MPNDLNQEHLQRMLHEYLAEKQPDMSDFDKQDINGLLNDALQGVDSARYLTGDKKKEVETFYDKHPVQATVHDLLNKAPALGTAAVGTQVGGSLLKDYLLNRKIDKTLKGTDKKPGLEPLTSKDFESQADLQRVFPKSHMEVPAGGGAAPTTKIQYNLDGDPGAYGELYQKMRAVKPDLQEPASTSAIGKLLGSSERKNERLVRLLARRFPKDTLDTQRPYSTPTGNPLPRAGGVGGEQHLHSIVSEIGGLNDGRATKVVEQAAQRLKDPNMGWKNMSSHLNKRLAIGAGALSLGGMALAPTISYLQKHVYGKPKVQEWMKNKRMTEGRFDE